jgi:hypothetical protein
LNKRRSLLYLVLLVLLLLWGLNSPDNIVDSQPLSVDLKPQVVPKQPELSVLTPGAYESNKQAIKALMDMKTRPIQDIKEYGYGAIPILTELYKEAESNREKSKIADVFWRLGWKSPQIEEALMGDLDSTDEGLKINVQWGIAKSTQSSEVINKLLYNLEYDSSALVRDKAACALASDFIHISPEQRIVILRGLIKGLSNDIQQVRNSSILALAIQTGQRKGFVATADADSRTESITVWHEWLDEYERNI